MVISFLLDKFTSRVQAYILSDSKFIIDLLNRNAFSYDFESLIVHILALKNAYSAHCKTIHFCWVPGHVGLAGAGRGDAEGVAVLTAELADPTGYGRILRNKAGRVTGIVEQKDATAISGASARSIPASWRCRR